MTYTRQEALDLLNGEHALENLRRLVAAEPAPAAGRDVNNHIHTTYSFFALFPPPRRSGSRARRGCAPAA